MRRRQNEVILRYLPDAAPADGHTDEYLQHRHTASERDNIKVRVKSGSTRQAVSHLPPSSDASPTGNRVPECRKRQPNGLCSLCSKRTLAGRFRERKIERCRKNNRIPIQMRWEISCREKRIYGDLEVKALVHVSVNEGFILSFSSMAK